MNVIVLKAGFALHNPASKPCIAWCNGHNVQSNVTENSSDKAMDFAAANSAFVCNRRDLVIHSLAGTFVI